MQLLPIFYEQSFTTDKFLTSFGACINHFFVKYWNNLIHCVFRDYQNYSLVRVFCVWVRSPIISQMIFVRSKSRLWAGHSIISILLTKNMLTFFEVCQGAFVNHVFLRLKWWRREFNNGLLLKNLFPNFSILEDEKGTSNQQSIISTIQSKRLFQIELFS